MLTQQADIAIHVLLSHILSFHLSPLNASFPSTHLPHTNSLTSPPIMAQNLIGLDETNIVSDLDWLLKCPVCVLIGGCKQPMLHGAVGRQAVSEVLLMRGQPRGRQAAGKHLLFIVFGCSLQKSSPHTELQSSCTLSPHLPITAHLTCKQPILALCHWWA